MIVSSSGFNFFNSNSFLANASDPLLCRWFSTDSHHHPEAADSATKRGSSDNPLVRCSFSYYAQISGSCLHFPERNEKNRNWCLCLSVEVTSHMALLLNMQPLWYTAHCNILTELCLSKCLPPDWVTTFSYNIIRTNANCILPVHNNFEANKPSLSSVL